MLGGCAAAAGSRRRQPGRCIERHRSRSGTTAADRGGDSGGATARGAGGDQGARGRAASGRPTSSPARRALSVQRKVGSRWSIVRRCARPTCSCSRARPSPISRSEIRNAGWRRRRLRGIRSNPVPHIALKPQAPGIETNLTIYTTRHIYHLILRSRGRAMQEVEFYYPDELLAAMKAADAAAAKGPQTARQSIRSELTPIAVKARSESAQLRLRRSADRTCR